MNDFLRNMNRQIQTSSLPAWAKVLIPAAAAVTAIAIFLTYWWVFALFGLGFLYGRYGR